MSVLACFLCSPETLASHFFSPLLKSFKFSCAHLEPHNESRSVLIFFCLVCFLGGGWVGGLQFS